MSILIIILGLLSVPAINAYNTYKQNRDLRSTEASLNVVANALSQYFITFSRLPCPADPTLNSTNANHGVEDCGGGWAGAVSPGHDFDGNGNADNYDGVPGPDTIITGSVPYADLEISLSDAVDAYGSKFSYAVTQSMTASPASTDWGAIQIQTINIDPGTGAVTPEDYIRIAADPDGPGPELPANDQDGNSLPDNGLLHLVVFSHGPDRKGGYSREGVQLDACNAANGQDAENCDGDALFLNSYAWSAPGANYYDDQILFRLWSFGSLWSLVPGTDNILNNNPGNVGIGTADPQEKLHVVGNVLANQIQSDFICDESGDNCFLPEAIGGDNDPLVGEGMRCSNPNEVMIGVSNGQADCQPVALTPAALYGQTCGLDGAGRQLFMAGINSDGSLNCVPTP